MTRITGLAGIQLKGCDISKYEEGLIMDIVLPPDFKEFLNLLKSKNIRYLLIGGYAVGYHGYPQSTNDMHISIAIKELGQT